MLEFLSVKKLVSFENKIYIQSKLKIHNASLPMSDLEFCKTFEN